MTRCPSSPSKQRHSNTGKGNPSNYKHGMRGHSWQKIIVGDEHIGRQCTKCKKKILNPKAVTSNERSE